MKLETGYNHAFEVRTAHCVTNCRSNFTVLYLSDCHFNKYSRLATEKIIDKINELNPDIILLGGDYVDTKAGLVYLNSLLNSIAARKNVFAVAGNHDYFFGIEEIKKIMAANNITWIEKGSVTFQLNNTVIQIDGNSPSSLEKNNADIAILCLHKPVDIDRYQKKYDLVFAGHLHGCQFVLWQSYKGLYPGRLFYKWNRLQYTLNDCHYFISKGLGDSLPIRFNCKKDMIFVTVA